MDGVNIEFDHSNNLRSNPQIILDIYNYVTKIGIDKIQLTDHKFQYIVNSGINLEVSLYNVNSAFELSIELFRGNFYPTDEDQGEIFEESKGVSNFKKYILGLKDLLDLNFDLSISNESIDSEDSDDQEISETLLSFSWFVNTNKISLSGLSWENDLLWIIHTISFGTK